MQLKTITRVILSSLLLASGSSFSATTVFPEPVISSSSQAQQKPISRSVSDKKPLTLSKLSATEILNKTKTDDPKRYIVGFARKLDQAKSSQQQQWVSQKDGSHIQTLTVSSPGAKSVRLVMDIQSLPDQAKLYFFSGDEQQSSAETDGKHINKILTLNANSKHSKNRYESPVINGDTASVEIHLPSDVQTSEAKLSINKIAHLSWSPFEARRLDEAGSSGSCQIDLACNQVEWGNAASSVAKILFSDESIEDSPQILCTGTLINDSDDKTQTAYFLTAEHCISTQEQASTLSTFWFFQKSNCGGPNPEAVQQVSGGAGLLAHGQVSDYSLLLLLRNPPADAVFAGWSLEPVSPFNTAITGIHHPGGDVKKISSGRVTGYTDNPPFVQPDNGVVIKLTDAITVRWSSGVTEGGSSGSPLFTDEQLIVGTLTGGLSSCSAPSSNDYYGRFDLAYPSLRAFLGAPGTSTSYLKNISTRSYTGTGDDVTIAGFTITGNNNKTVVIRAAGPSVAKASNGDTLTDTTLELLRNGQIISSNDNWIDSPDADSIRDAGFGLSSDNESAIKISLSPGSYTAIMRGKNKSTGIGLIAVDEFDTNGDSRLSNISTRALVNDGDQVAIGGFIINGTEDKTVIIRAIGPSMGDLGVPNTLADPIIEIYSGANKIAENDDWQTDPNSGSVQGYGLAPKYGLESAIMLTLAPGSYTVKTRGRNGSTGVALIAVDEI